MGNSEQVGQFNSTKCRVQFLGSLLLVAKKDTVNGPAITPKHKQRDSYSNIKMEVKWK